MGCQNSKKACAAAAPASDRLSQAALRDGQQKAPAVAPVPQDEALPGAIPAAAESNEERFEKPHVPLLPLSSLPEEAQESSAAPEEESETTIMEVVEVRPSEQLLLGSQESEGELSTVREVVSDGPVKPQPKTLISKSAAGHLNAASADEVSAPAAAGAVAVVPLAASSEEQRGREDSDDLLMSETQTMIIETPQARPGQELGAARSSALALLGQSLEVMQKTISDAVTGATAGVFTQNVSEKPVEIPIVVGTAPAPEVAAVAAEQQQQEDTLSSARSRLEVPQPQEVPFPTLLTGSTRTPRPVMAQKMKSDSSSDQEKRHCLSSLTVPPSLTPRLEGRMVAYQKAAKLQREDCGNSVDDVFRSCIGHRDKAPVSSRSHYTARSYTAS